MSNQLGWVQFSKALDAGRAGGRRSAWGADERPARPARRDRYSAPGHHGPRGLRLGWALAVVAVVAVTIVSWAVTAGAAPLPSQLALPGGAASEGPSGMIAAGQTHVCVVLADLTVSCWGDNTEDQLGAVTAETFSIGPVVVAGLTDVEEVTAGRAHSCALLTSGSIRCWGAGFEGQLGDGLSISSVTPVDVVGISDAVAVRAGGEATCALRDSGRVSCWGGNDFGQLGDGTNDDAPTPVEVTGITDAASIAVGSNSSCAVLQTGAMRCWGANDYGLLGNDDAEVDSVIPVDVVGITDAVSVGIGDYHACAVRSGGEMMCWGYNEDGELGNGTLNQSPVPVAVLGMAGAVATDLGGNASCALTRTGSVSCWGSAFRGALGNGQTEGVSTVPTAVMGVADAFALAVGFGHSCVVRVDASVWCWGESSDGQAGSGLPGRILEPLAISGVGPAVHVATGAEFSCAQLVDTSVSCWGASDRGQLGNGTTASVSGRQTVSGLAGVSDLTAGEFHACAVLADHSMRCWGANFSGQLGDGTTSDSTSPVVVSGLADVVEAAAGDRHTCARLNSGSASCWGFGFLGRLGNGSLSNELVPTTVSTITNVAAITAGGDHSCAAMDGGAVGCWGANTQGALGDNTTTFRTVPTPVSTVPNDFVVVDGGGSHTCAARAAATMCWGSNGNGQLGDGTQSQRLTPVAVSGIAGSLVRAGGGHSCGILQGGGVKCWGENFDGQLGDGTQSQRLTPVDVIGIGPASDLDLGEDHTCVVLADGTVECWGDNSEGQIGKPSYFPVPVQTAVGGAAVPQIAIPLSPARLLDTRSANSTVDGLFAGGGRRGAGSVLELTVTGRGGVPVGAAAVVLNVTVVDPLAAGFATVFPCGSPVPVASSLNYGPGDVVPNELVAKVGDANTGVEGKVCVFTDAATHVLADVVGYLPAGPGYAPLSPARLLDTRSANSTVDGLFAGGGRRGAGSVLELTVTGRGGVPVGAAAVVLNVTVVDPLAAGFATVFPCGSPVPVASSLNYGPGDVVPNELVAKVGDANTGVEGKVCVFTDAATHVLADVVGYLPAGPGYAPLSPARLLDTRSANSTVDGLFAGGGRRGAGSVLELTVTGRGGVPVGAAAVVLNVTVVDPLAAGFATVFPCGSPVPVASSLNYGPGDVVPNELVAKVGVDGKVCVFTDAATHVLADVVGYLP